jgi:predicted component of type VI protein secretion system
MRSELPFQMSSVQNFAGEAANVDPGLNDREVVPCLLFNQQAANDEAEARLEQNAVAVANAMVADSVAIEPAIQLVVVNTTAMEK